MAIANIISNTGDGDISSGNQATFTAARDATTGTTEVTIYTQVNRIASNNWVIRRSYLPFDLSSIPAGSTITGVTLGVTPKTITFTGGAGPVYDYLQFFETAIGSAPNLASGDFDELLGSTTIHDGNIDPIDDLTVDVEEVITLNSSGISYVQAALDASNYCEIAVNIGYDIQNQALGTDGNGLVEFYASTDTGDEPTLSITYIPGPGAANSYAYFM